MLNPAVQTEQRTWTVELGGRSFSITLLDAPHRWIGWPWVELPVAFEADGTEYALGRVGTPTPFDLAGHSGSLVIQMTMPGWITRAIIDTLYVAWWSYVLEIDDQPAGAWVARTVPNAVTTEWRFLEPGGVLPRAGAKDWPSSASAAENSSPSISEGAKPGPVEQRPNDMRDGVAVDPAMPGTDPADVTRARGEFLAYLPFLGVAAGLLLAFAVRLLDGTIGLSQLLAALGEEIHSFVVCLGAKVCTVDVGPQPDLGPPVGAAIAGFGLGFGVAEVLVQGLGALGQTLRQPWLTRIRFSAGSFSALAVPCLAVLYYLLAAHGEAAIGWTLLAVGLLTGLLFGFAGVWLVAHKLRSRSG